MTISAVIAAGVHLFPFRTEKLSPPAPMVLGGQPPGRVGRRRITFTRAAERAALRVSRMAGMEIRGDGIVLRPWRDDDLEALTAACQDTEIARWLPMVPSPYSEDDGRDVSRAGPAELGARRRLQLRSRRRVGSSARLDRDPHPSLQRRAHRLLDDARRLVVAGLRRRLSRPSAGGLWTSSALVAWSSRPTRTTTRPSGSRRRPVSSGRESCARLSSIETDRVATPSSSRSCRKS